MITFKNALHEKEFSCSFPDIEFTISGSYADVEISATRSGQDESVFLERLYPDGSGTIKIEEMDRLLEQVAEQWLVFNVTVRVTESDNTTSSLNTQVVSCRAVIKNATATEFCNSHFLTLFDGVRQTSPGWLEFLTYTGNDHALCTAYYADGQSKEFSVEHTTYQEEYSMIDVSPNNFLYTDHKLVRYVITAGGRSQTYYVEDGYSDVAPILLFFNSFGVQELAYCTGEHQRVASYDRKQARIGREKQNYDITEKSTFKADTGILTFPMADWWREVLRSKAVQVMSIYHGVVDQNSATPIVINTEKVEMSNLSESEPRFTFEYEFADRNHNIYDVRRDGRIFDNTFDYTFN